MNKLPGANCSKRNLKIHKEDYYDYRTSMSHRQS